MIDLKDYVNWDTFSCDAPVDAESLREYKEYINWPEIWHNHKLSEEVIR